MWLGAQTGWPTRANGDVGRAAAPRAFIGPRGRIGACAALLRVQSFGRQQLAREDWPPRCSDHPRLLAGRSPSPPRPQRRSPLTVHLFIPRTQPRAACGRALRSSSLRRRRAGRDCAARTPAPGCWHRGYLGARPGRLARARARAHTAPGATDASPSMRLSAERPKAGARAAMGKPDQAKPAPSVRRGGPRIGDAVCEQPRADRPPGAPAQGKAGAGAGQSHLADLCPEDKQKVAKLIKQVRGGGRSSADAPGAAPSSGPPLQRRVARSLPRSSLRWVAPDRRARPSAARCRWSRWARRSRSWRRRMTRWGWPLA